MGLVLLMGSPCWWPANAKSEIIHAIDFSGHGFGSAIDWLRARGFSLKLDAEDLNPRFENDAIVLSTYGEKAGLIGKTFADHEILYGVKRVRIEWGVRRYPQGADWERGVKRVPIALILTFGKQKLSSGLPFIIESAPYFLSPFIGLKEREGKMYLGKYYKKGGRYFCVASGNQVGKTIVTDFEVDERFRTAFNKLVTPPITAFAFQMNTKDTYGGAEAFLRRVEFLSE